MVVGRDTLLTVQYILINPWWPLLCYTEDAVVFKIQAPTRRSDVILW